MNDPIKGLNQLIRMYEKHAIVEMRCTKAINYINLLQAENAVLKAELEKANNFIKRIQASRKKDNKRYEEAIEDKGRLNLYNSLTKAKAERDKYKSIVEGLPSYDDIYKKIDNYVLPDFEEPVAKAIHKLIHRGE